MRSFQKLGSRHGIMPTSDLILAIERRLRALGHDDPIFIADTIRAVLNGNFNLSLEEAMDSFEAFMDSSLRKELNLQSENFPDLKYESIVLREFQKNAEFHHIANILKDQFSSRGKGFGKMVPRPIDFAGFAKLSEEKIDKKTLFFTIMFWIILYSLIFYYY